MLALPVFFTGCGTTPASKAAQGEKILIQTVNDGMERWAVYVSAGKATQAQVDQVRHSYNDYVVAQTVAKAAIEKAMASNATSSSADFSTANQAVTTAEQSLLSLLNQLLK